MKTAWQAALTVGIVSLLMGIIEHFLTIGGGAGIFGWIATPNAFMNFAMVMFLMALVFQLGQLLDHLEAKKEADQSAPGEQ